MDITRNVLYMVEELSQATWVILFDNGTSQRMVSVRGGDWTGLLKALELAKKKMKMAPDAAVISCHEAGRDGFWIHRMLVKYGVQNVVVNPSSIEVSRKHRRAKTDRLDAYALMRQLKRWHTGDDVKALRPVQVPTEKEEDDRRLHRQKARLKMERAAHKNRIRSLLVLHGFRPKRIDQLRMETLRDWEDKPLPPGMQNELVGEQKRLALVEAMIDELSKKQVAAIKPEAVVQTAEPSAAVTVKLARLRGVGMETAWQLGHEFFWRKFDNRRQVGAAAGLTGVPYDSGNSTKEQGISKEGSALVRTLMVESAWNWLRFQPDSELSRWFTTRFAANGKRMRRIGIVALARKLLVAFWKWLQHDTPPMGALIRTG